MNRLFKYVGTFLFIVGFSAAAAAQPFDDIAKALSAGNATVLAGYFDANVELSIGNDDGAYSKAQAEQMGKRFFKDVKPSPFKFMHKGSNDSNSNYAIGTLSTNKGSYRTMVLLKKTGGKYVLRKLEIEKE